MGSTIQVLFYLAAFSSLKAFFHWDPTCYGKGIPFKIHISISWQGFPYFFSSSYVCTFSTYLLFLPEVFCCGFCTKNRFDKNDLDIHFT